MWPAGQLVVGSALGANSSGNWRWKFVAHCHRRTRCCRNPPVFPAECIFKDHETGPEIGMATSLPLPLLGEIAVIGIRHGSGA